MFQFWWKLRLYCARIALPVRKKNALEIPKPWNKHFIAFKTNTNNKEHVSLQSKKYKNSDHLLVETPRFPGLWPGVWTWLEIFKERVWQKYSLTVLFERSNTWVLPSRPGEIINYDGVYVDENLYNSSLHSQWHWPPSKEGKYISPLSKGPLPPSLLVGPPSPVPHPPATRWRGSWNLV